MRSPSLVFTAFGLLAAHARVAKKSKACFIASGEAKQKMPEAMKQEKSKRRHRYI
jgi:hypothetical protein